MNPGKKGSYYGPDNWLMNAHTIGALTRNRHARQLERLAQSAVINDCHLSPFPLILIHSFARTASTARVMRRKSMAAAGVNISHVTHPIHPQPPAPSIIWSSSPPTPPSSSILNTRCPPSLINITLPPPPTHHTHTRYQVISPCSCITNLEGNLLSAHPIAIVIDTVVRHSLMQAYNYKC
jgi:hypothetical protein